jgi:hypothetical protein
MGYGPGTLYDWCNSPSIMSYNPLHWTNDFTPASQYSMLYRFSITPDNSFPPFCSPPPGLGVDGTLLPEDINAVANNKRVFPNAYFDPELDLIPGQPINRQTAPQGEWPLNADESFYSLAFQLANGLPGTSSQSYNWSGNAPPSNVQIISPTGTYAGKVTNILGPLIRKNSASVGWDSSTMWFSNESSANNGWFQIYVQFPEVETLTGIVAHTGFNGGTYGADEICVEEGNWGNTVTCQMAGSDDTLSFPATAAQGFYFWFHSPNQAGAQYVALRGLQFLTPDGEIFPHGQPEENLFLPVVTTTPNNEAFSSKVTHVIGPTIVPSNSATGWMPTNMWHSAQVNSWGWTSIQITFPYPVTLHGVDVHSQHSGLYHAADQVQVEYLDPSTNQFTYVTRQNTGPDATVMFNNLKQRTWKIDFHSSDGAVTIRGLRFRTPVNAIYHDTPDCIIYSP